MVQVGEAAGSHEEKSSGKCGARLWLMESMLATDCYVIDASLEAASRARTDAGPRARWFGSAQNANCCKRLGASIRPCT